MFQVPDINFQSSYWLTNPFSPILLKTKNTDYNPAIPLGTWSAALLLITGSLPRSAHGGGQEQAQGAGPALHEPGRHHRHRFGQRALPPLGPRTADPNPQQEPCSGDGQEGASRAAPARPDKHPWASFIWRSGPHGNNHFTSTWTSVRSGLVVWVYWEEKYAFIYHFVWLRGDDRYLCYVFLLSVMWCSL